jgi:hypothetical protein
MDFDQYHLQELPGSGMDYDADSMLEMNDFTDINLSSFLETASAVLGQNFNNNTAMNTMNGSS